jgi:hypothetical protein
MAKLESENIKVHEKDRFQGEYLTRHIMMQIDLLTDKNDGHRIMNVIMLGRDYPSLEGHRISEAGFNFSINIPPVHEGQLLKFAENIKAFNEDFEYLKETVITPIMKEYDVK